MPQSDPPQIYLITPGHFDLATFAPTLERVLDGRDIACVRLSLVTQDETELTHACDTLRDICHARDVALVVDSHYRLAARLGLDGVHFTDGPKQVRAARKELGKDAIIGAYCGQSRDSGLSAGEAGADYVSFGPVAASALGSGETAPPELFYWWSQMIEVPLVAEGGLTAALAAQLAPHADFLAIGDEIWNSDSALDGLRALLTPPD